MSKLAQSLRLGIVRGWRVQLITDVKLFAVSLIHCMFIYTLLRAKAFRLGFWIVAYFVKCLLKKYIIHVFFWRLPGVKKNRLFKFPWCVQIKFERETRKDRQLTPIRLRFYPTRISLKLFRFWRKKQNLKKSNKICLTTFWHKNQLLFKFWYLHLFSINIKNYSSGFGKINSCSLKNVYSPTKK